jgi:cupin superfamily acireductone dioxygenase involved in methionine salvage
VAKDDVMIVPNKVQHWFQNGKVGYYAVKVW